MNTQKETWTINPAQKEGWEIQKENASPIALVYPRFYEGETGEEKAKLIAAAPEMLEALKAFLDFDKVGGLDNREKAVKLAEKAIKKATE